MVGVEMFKMVGHMSACIDDDLYRGDEFVVITAAGIPKGDDNCRDGTAHIFTNRIEAELDAKIFSGERIMRYADYLAMRQRAIDEAVRRVCRRGGYILDRRELESCAIPWSFGKEIQDEFSHIMAGDA